MKKLSNELNTTKENLFTYSRLHVGDYLPSVDLEQKVIPPFKVRYITLSCCE